MKKRSGWCKDFIQYVHEKKDQGGAKTSKQLVSDPVLLIDTTEYDNLKSEKKYKRNCSFEISC